MNRGKKSIKLSAGEAIVRMKERERKRRRGRIDRMIVSSERAKIGEKRFSNIS
jgi:hypothetical protein